jgi:exodeoxyribonuclease X
VPTVVPLLTADQIERLPVRARAVVEYRKSGLSLNHVQGCPLDCAYCIRHTYGLWDQRQPRALMSDAEAVKQLVEHRYFQPNVTAVQLFNISLASRFTMPVILTTYVDMAGLVSVGRVAQMTSWTTLRYAVVDVEGNGHQPPDLVELAVVSIRGGIIGEPADWLFKPEQPITSMATRIHGITNKDVENNHEFVAMKDAVSKALEADVLVAHAAHVDVGVLQRKLGDWQCPEVFDTLKLARRLLPNRKSYRLGALVDEFSLDSGLPENMKPHRAGYDAIVCARLFAYLAGRYSLEELRGRPAGGGDDEAAALF